MKKQHNTKAIAELIYIKRLITEIYPTGIVSLVSDTFNLWDVLTFALPKLKDTILARDGGPNSLDKVVIRPDSGNPVKILCGDPSAEEGSPEHKGVVELLWDLFGGTVNEHGYKVLDSHIGAIYGDAITIPRCRAICEQLKEKGFASTNVVYGIGSFTYQYNTRDTLGFAMKSTSVTIDGKQMPIFKDPKTDDGTKKSALGRVTVHRLAPKDQKDSLYYIDESDEITTSSPNLLTPLFHNGTLVKETSLSEIRRKL